MINVAVIGATGLVGSTLLQILRERKFPSSHLALFASRASQGQSISFGQERIVLDVLSEDKLQNLNLAFFVADDPISRKWVPIALKAGVTVIDNAATFRMDPQAVLIVPEVNGHLLSSKPHLIANPNCSTIQMAVALWPLDQKFGIETIKVATYQSVSGSGKAAIEELKHNTLADLKSPSQNTKSQVYPHNIAFNNLPHIGSFNNEGFCTEEIKMRNEMRKIFNNPSLKITAFCVRTPTLNAHSEAIWVTFKQKTNLTDILSCLKSAPGIQVIDHPSQNQYPLARMASGQDHVFVGRIHQDPDDDRTWLMWVVADNIRKGAALNAVQIAEILHDL